MIVTRVGSSESYLTTIAAISICTGVLVHILGTLDNLRTQYVVALVQEASMVVGTMVLRASGRLRVLSISAVRRPKRTPAGTRFRVSG